VWISDLSCTVDISMDISQSFFPLNCHIVSSAGTESQSIKQFLCGLSSGTTARSTESQLMSNGCVLRRWRNHVRSSGRSFHVCGPATGKTRLPTVDSLLIGTTRGLVPTGRSDRRLGRSETRVKGQVYESDADVLLTKQRKRMSPKVMKSWSTSGMRTSTESGWNV